MLSALAGLKRSWRVVAVLKPEGLGWFLLFRFGWGSSDLLVASLVLGGSAPLNLSCNKGSRRRLWRSLRFLLVDHFIHGNSPSAVEVLYHTVYLVGSAEAVFSKFSKLLENGLKRCVLLSYTHILGFSLGGQL